MKKEFEINGFIVFSESNLLIKEEVIVSLTWLERLISWPWKPWIKDYKVYHTVADPQVYVIEKEMKIIGHPDSIQLLSRRIIETIEENKESDS